MEIIPVKPYSVSVYRNIPGGYASGVSFPKNLRALRRAADLRQDELGDLLGVGQGAVSKWEKGRSQPDALMLPAIALAVGTTLDTLLKGVSAQYDATIDLTDHGVQVKQSPRRQKGDAVDPASAHRIVALERENAALKAQIRRMQDAARRFAKIAAAGRQSVAPTGTAPGPGRRD